MTDSKMPVLGVEVIEGTINLTIRREVDGSEPAIAHLPLSPDVARALSSDLLAAADHVDPAGYVRLMEDLAKKIEILGAMRGPTEGGLH